MNPGTFALAVGVAVFVAGWLGHVLRRVLPERHVTGAAKDMIGAVVGLLTLLSALVLGLLIWTAYGVYAGQNIAIQTIAAKALQLDLALSDYGPDAKDVRAQVRQALAKSIDEVWGTNQSDAAFAANTFASAIHNMRERDAALASLHSSTDPQKRALDAAEASVNSIAQSRLQMAFALTNPISIPLIVIVAGWAALLFFGFGLMSGGDSAGAFIATALGAVAVASAVFLILELSNPYSGLFRASPAPFEQVLAIMGKE